MRLAPLLILIASVSPLAAADDSDGGPAEAHSDFRKLLLSEYKFVPSPETVAPPAPLLFSRGFQPQPVVPEPDNADVVIMAPYNVREIVKMNTLHADIIQERANARTAAVMDKLGVGLHVAPVGKTYFYVATAFYIPFTAGFGFSW
jgi:hypothetical protein